MHEWGTSVQFHKCEHGQLDGNKAWLKPGSAAHKALQDVVFDVKMLTDMGKLTQFCHTGSLENYHSVYLKYVPKRLHFSYAGQ